MDRAVTAMKSGKFSVLQLAQPSKAVQNIGILLLDPGSGRLYKKLRSDWSAIADPEYVEMLEALDDDFDMKIAELGADAFLRGLEDALSNVLRITNRVDVSVSDFRRALDRLYEEHVQR